ncbi:hypothetical protein E0H80_06200 [Acinetobacter sp. ANC 4779]|nr:hypothetical protein E0H80_06200 [Acinetobacter sp. ANC 4779]
MKQREVLGIKLPDPPKYSFTANALIEAYNTIARSRRYEHTPLALGAEDIKSYLELYELPCELHIFIDCIFALDNLFIDESHKRMSKR